jgi:hypothetical protein
MNDTHHSDGKFHFTLPAIYGDTKNGGFNNINSRREKDKVEWPERRLNQNGDCCKSVNCLGILGPKLPKTEKNYVLCVDILKGFFAKS